MGVAVRMACLEILGLAPVDSAQGNS